ncbi:hypothetical protein PSECIP111951_00958 [Pseudoalteromonas holothuriae]|uniref:DUF3087 domain-containing protein n=1 Tax=Pseudoalteromonas holothuriae TaxID=2963714 RepID=A0ABM9GFB0_9GAMM|nr:DUF3087 domain-containing protein [Pseudoalteromonas sp. CIP111951]CAH9054096.1 hypothetical protein PSECIP111951_00958 [Pseudoalteromonas sp. CIP111951]
MQLKKIDKARYRNHLNKVIAACVASLATGSLGIAQALIVIFPDADGSHFHWNLLGVIVSVVAIALVLKKYRTHSFMYEVNYVWELKQSLNKVTRKMAKLKKAAQEGDADAMLAMQFSYSGSKQLWELDDNTITLDDLSIWQAQLDTLASRYQVQLDLAQYNESSLKNF